MNNIHKFTNLQKTIDEYMKIGDEHMENIKDIGDEHMENIEENTEEWINFYIQLKISSCNLLTAAATSPKKNWLKLMKRWKDLKQIYKFFNNISVKPWILMMPWNEEIVRTRQKTFVYMKKSAACKMQHVVLEKEIDF